jgi:4-diphosphocytidyl-2-C-methyl-D-erythritol kinase
MRLLAPAKINLHLRVGPPAADGFHPLLTWMCTVALFDILQMQFSSKESGSLVELSCDDSRIPSDATNLVVRGGNLVANSLAATREGAAIQPIRVDLAKRIPSGAGLGGGSSDAARAMLGFDQLWKGKLGSNTLAELSSRVGSDIPFFFFGASSICMGRGEFVRPIAAPSRAKWAVLILPSIMMPTPAVYRKFDELQLGGTQRIKDEPPWLQWLDLSAGELLEVLINDLEPAAFAIAPELGEIRKKAQAIAGRPVRMSGSGSTLFSLFDEQAAAEKSASNLQGELGVQTIPVALAPSLNDDLIHLNKGQGKRKKSGKKARINWNQDS